MKSRSMSFEELQDNDRYIEVFVAKERIFDCDQSEHYCHVFIRRELAKNIVEGNQNQLKESKS